MTSSRKPNTNPSEEILEKLEELSILNLDGEHNDSPSYGTASLPTPEPPRADFNMRASPYQAAVRIWYHDDGDSAQGMNPANPPGAPLLKDMDSFTEGSGCGSFEDLPAAATNELGELIHPPTMTMVSFLPPADSLLEYIEEWRTAVHEDTTLPVKRRRSPSPGGERRIRPRTRTRTRSLPSSFRNFTQSIGVPATRSEPEAPD